MSRAWDKNLSLEIFSLSHAHDIWIITSSYFLFELKFYYVPLFIILQGTFEIADPSSMHGTRHHELGFEESVFSVPPL